MKSSRVHYLLIGLVFLALGAVSVLSPVSGNPAACVEPPSDLVSWWPAENSAEDVSDGNDGTVQGASFAPGTVGQAFSFDGSDDYVGVPDAANLDGQTQLTAEAWIRPDSLGWPNPDPDSDYEAAIISKYNSSPSDQRSYSFGLRDGYLRLSIYGPGGDLHAVSDAQVAIGSWSHVAGVWDGSTITLYVDGTALAATTTGTSPSQTNDSNTAVNIGRIEAFSGTYSGPAAFFDGLIDEVTLYDRALSAGEVSGIAGAGSSGKCRDSATATPTPTATPTATPDATMSRVLLPVVARPLNPPTLNPVNNNDWDNLYSVSWDPLNVDYYTLEESQSAAFSEATVAYQGMANSWSVPAPGKYPGTYYYRAKAHSGDKESGWSNIESVEIKPLYVGLKLRWDGVGYLNIGQYYQPGWHITRNADAITSPGIIRIRSRDWYDPDPLGFGETIWNDFYSVTTGNFLSKSIPVDPAWKWGNPWIVPYDVAFQNGQTINVSGQPFLVSGPHSGVTSFGQPVQYWELTNKERFLLFDDGGEWTQYVHAGDAKLRYDAGVTRLLIYRDILRRYYQDGDLSEYTVQYISNLTEADSFPGGSVSADHGSDGRPEINNDQAISSPLPGLGRVPLGTMLPPISSLDSAAPNSGRKVTWR